MDNNADMINKERIRQPAHSLQLCDGVYVHYTFSAVAVKNRKRGNAANQIKLSLYSSFCKKKVGSEVRVQYTTPIKKVRKAAAAGERPKHTPPAEKVMEGIQKLFRKNAQLCGDDLTKTEQQAAILSTKLAVFWLQHQEGFCAKYAEKEEEATNFDKMMTQVLLCWGNLDLQVLRSEEDAKPVFAEAVNILRQVIDRKAYALIEKSLGKTAQPSSTSSKKKQEQSVTNRTHEYAVLLRNVFQEFLLQQKLGDGQRERIIRLFTKTFAVRPTLAITMGKGLRSKSLSVEEYRLLWQMLVGKEIDSLALGQLFMLFLGLSAEEVCALDTEDLVPVVNYNAVQLCVTKRCVDLNGKITVSTELPRPENYRNIPIPRLLQQLLPKREKNRVLLPDPKTGRRIDPKKLKKAFRSLFQAFKVATLAYQRKDGRTTGIRVSFRPENYQQSCHHFWQFVCGLQQNEIRYLGGMAQIDTAGRHYIDFNNAHKQYRMFVQMSYGLMAIAAPGSLPSAAPGGFVPSKCVIDGVFGHVLHTRFYIRKPCVIKVRAAHSISVKKEEGVLLWDYEKNSS